MSDVNLQQYQFIVDNGVIATELLQPAVRRYNPDVHGDLCDFLIQLRLLSSHDAESVRRLTLGTVPKVGESRVERLQLIETHFLSLEQLYPLFSPHARAQFELIENLGEGGMGVVHRIEDKKLGRTAALKVLALGGADERAVTRFIREAKITASLVHPNIPPIYELGMNSLGEHYMLMKVIEGQSLRAAINEVHGGGESNPKEIRHLLEALVKVCEAMAYAHSREVIHRDLKPENIMIGEFGEVMVLDWGLAKDLSADQEEDIALKDLRSVRLREAAQKEGLTGGGDLLGTVGYMAPEQVDGQASKQSDVFALGAILTEILTGKSAISGEGLIAKLSATIQGRIRGPRDLLKSAPKELNALALKATRVSPKDRTESIEGFVADLQAFLEGEELRVYRYGLLVRSQRWMSRHPTLLSNCFLILLLVLTGYSFARNLANLERMQVESKVRETQELSMRQRLARTLTLFNSAENKANRGLSRVEMKEELEEALILGGRTEFQLLRAARIYVKAKMFEEAQAILEEVERRFSPAFEALYQLHEIETRDAKSSFFVPESAVLRRLLSESKRLNRRNEFTLLAEATIVQPKTDRRRILRLCNEATLYTRGNWRVFALRGTALFELGDFSGALIDFNQAAILAPENDVVFSLRGNTKSRLEEYEGALLDFSRAINLSPVALHFFNRGVVYEKIGIVERAIEDYSRSIRLEPGLPQVFYNRGRLYKIEKRYKKAAFDFEKALALKPNYFLAHSELGQVKAALGDLDGALRHFNSAISLDSSAVIPYVTRADLWRRMNKRSRAVQDYKKALNLDAKFFNARVGLAQVLEKNGELRAAIRCYTEGLIAGGDDYRYYNNRGALRAKLKDFVGAMKDYNLVSKLNPNFTSVHMNKANMWIQLGENKKAAREVELYLSFHRGNPLDKERRAFIEKHLGRPSKY